MAYGRRRYNRRRPAYRRRPYVNKTKKLVTGEGPTLLEKIASGVGTAASVAKAVLPIVAAINTEAKYLDTANGLAPTLAAPSIVNISAMAQGLTDKTRIGNSILAKSIFCKVRVVGTMTNDTGPQYHSVRIMLIVDKLQGGTAPTISQIMESTSTNLSMGNKNYTDRFTILKDKIIDMNNMYYDGSNPSLGVKSIKFFKKLDFHIRYIGTDAASTSMGPNALYLVGWPLASSGLAFTFYCRLNYTDN